METGNASLVLFISASLYATLNPYRKRVIYSESEHRMQLQSIPCFLAIGCGICEAADGNLRDRGTALACPEWCGGLSLEDTVCSFHLTKPPAGTVKEELQLTTVVIYSHCV